jgi:high affinity choline transporter 7
MSVFIGGLVSIIIFYVLILGVGIWAGRKQKSTEKNPDTEEVMLAGRNIGLIVGIFTMTGKHLIISALKVVTKYLCNNIES